MKKLKPYATSLTTLLFLVVGISGVLMYFHLFDGTLKELHEILGLGFVAVVILHVTANWTLMKKYFTNKIFISSAVLVVAISTVFLTNSSDGKGVNPEKLVFEKIMSKPLKDTVNFLAIDKSKIENLSKSLKIDATKSIITNAKENKVSPFDIIDKLFGQES